MTTRLLPLLTWRAAICDSELGSTTRLVALTLSLYMNERGGSAFPGAERLAHDTGLTDRAVRTHLGILTAKGWLELVERGGMKGERRHANVYQARNPLGITTPESGSPLNVDALTPEPDDTDPGTTFRPSLQELSKNSRSDLRTAKEIRESWYPEDLAEPTVAADGIRQAHARMRGGQ